MKGEFSQLRLQRLTNILARRNFSLHSEPLSYCIPRPRHWRNSWHDSVSRRYSTAVGSSFSVHLSESWIVPHSYEMAPRSLAEWYTPVALNGTRGQWIKKNLHDEGLSEQKLQAEDAWIPLKELRVEVNLLRLRRGRNICVRWVMQMRESQVSDAEAVSQLVARSALVVVCVGGVVRVVWKVKLTFLCQHFLRDKVIYVIFTICIHLFIDSITFWQPHSSFYNFLSSLTYQGVSLFSVTICASQVAIKS